MTIRAKLLLTCVTGALVTGAGPMISDALAQSKMPAVEPVPFWWFHGEIEAGGRFYLNNPEKGGVASQGGKSLAKYYEYQSAKPGAFLNGHLSTGTIDGLYQIDLWAKNVGYDDQKFSLDASKAGEHYFNVGWDQTPHLYSDSAQTIYNGVGTNHLTLPAGLSNTLWNNSGNGANLPTAAQQNAIQKTLNANSYRTDVGIRRDTADVEYRWTPTDAWDINANYSHMHRKGTQVEGVVFSPGTSGVVSQVTKPVNDTTQNYGLNGEYAGTSLWNQKFNFKLGYAGSTYKDADDSYTVENPFCPTGAVGTTCARTGSASSPVALMSLWPDNQANGFNATLGADLPMKSRYMGTVSYNMMRQDAAFLPFSANNTVIAGTTLPASSLNGAINTTLINNALTTQITPELKSKLSYRYYDFNNNTPELLFNNWILTDTEKATAANVAYAPVHSISVSYNKQNAGADLNWRPTHAWNLGAIYGYERYDWNRADVDVTNENSGKVFADWKPVSWITARASWLYGVRRYENYDYLGNVGNFQWVSGGATGATKYSSAMRQFFLNDRDRNKAQFSVAVDIIHGLTVTPTFGYEDDVYSVSGSELGLTRTQAWRAGAELAYALNPATTLLLSYMNEQSHKDLTASTSSTVPSPVANIYNTTIKDTVNTFMGGVNFAVIPGKFDLGLSYTVALTNDSQPVVFGNGTLPSTGQYPDVNSMWQRLEATAKYKFDKETVQQLGWTGEVTAKLRYAWERNGVDNWQNDLMSNYIAAFSPSYSYMTWLGYNNPNYNVHLLGASLSWAW